MHIAGNVCSFPPKTCVHRNPTFPVFFSSVVGLRCAQIVSISGQCETVAHLTQPTFFTTLGIRDTWSAVTLKETSGIFVRLMRDDQKQLAMKMAAPC